MIQDATQRQQFGPGDHGRRVPYEEFMTAEYEGGYHYEIIDGKIYVHPMSEPDDEWVETGLLSQFFDYTKVHPGVIWHVTGKARVFVPGRKEVTVPEPDFAAYQEYPQKRRRGLRWEDISPILVAEVVSVCDPDKDFVRNVELYWEVPSIKEYWVIDAREVPEHPLTVYRRLSVGWQIIQCDYRPQYTTRLLPGFELRLEPLLEYEDQDAEKFKTAQVSEARTRNCT
jgi:Uma2 family endonuclease